MIAARAPHPDGSILGQARVRGVMQPAQMSGLYYFVPTWPLPGAEAPSSPPTRC